MYLYEIVGGSSHEASWSLRCLPPRPTTRTGDNLCGRRQLALIARQGSAAADLWSNRSSAGTINPPPAEVYETLMEKTAAWDCCFI